MTKCKCKCKACDRECVSAHTVLLGSGYNGTVWSRTLGFRHADWTHNNQLLKQITLFDGHAWTYSLAQVCVCVCVVVCVCAYMCACVCVYVCDSKAMEVRSATWIEMMEETQDTQTAPRHA